MWEVIARASSTVIALCALGLTVWQAYIARRHNKLSVRPHLTTWIHSDKTNHIYTVDLLNNGVGPAFIKDFKLLVDGHAIVGEGYEPVEKALKVLFSKYQYTSCHAFVGPGYGMAANESRQLMAVQFRGTNLPKPEEVDHAIKRARLLINYSSIYEETFVLDSDALRANPSF
jgi:hypothetical protein